MKQQEAWTVGPWNRTWFRVSQELTFLPICQLSYLLVQDAKKENNVFRAWVEKIVQYTRNTDVSQIKMSLGWTERQCYTVLKVLPLQFNLKEFLSL